MTKIPFRIVDVFTAHPFGGNQLAVVTNGRGLSTQVMQAIAREFNFSETTFVLPPEDPANTYKVRIFTPTYEMPMAGHPTVGTAFVLAKEGMLKDAEIVFEEGVGPVPVTIEWKDGAPEFIEMRQPLPKFGPRFEDLDAIAQMLSVEPHVIRDMNLPVEVVSCGVPFLFVPFPNLRAIRDVRVRADLWEQTLGDVACEGVFVFTSEVEFPGSTIHSRM